MNLKIYSLDMEKIKLVTLSSENKNEFLEELKAALYTKFGDDIPENYGHAHDWSLMNLILSDEIDTYQLLFVDDKFWTGTGGIVRNFNDAKVYQAAFRGFSMAGKINTGLGVKTPTFVHCLGYQIERARINNCSSVVLSFNDHNKRLFEVTRKYTLPKSFPAGVWLASDKPVLFNGVDQWLITMKL